MNHCVFPIFFVGIKRFMSKFIVKGKKNFLGRKKLKRIEHIYYAVTSESFYLLQFV